MQNNWRIIQRLVVNYGLRMEHLGPWTVTAFKCGSCRFKFYSAHDVGCLVTTQSRQKQAKLPDAVLGNSAD